ncbi:MAG: DUF5331 domain-containing protein [Iphinoe sp. HA4291-MV1]|jgi:hypothetical protein|nr:DUF5331 domain-containing protein [Iphinoe sp. HA4291-MV1]
MAFFDSFTESLKQKWLQFFQVNRDWISLHMEVESVYTPDGGRRPSSYLILGVINALEPKLAQLMLPFSKLNPDADTLVEVLELNFDPDIALGNHALPKLRIEKHGEESDVIYENSNDETLTNPQINRFGQEGKQALRALTPTMDNVTKAKEFKASQNSVSNASSNEKNSNNELVDELKEVDSKTSATTASDESGFANALSDAWGAETTTQNREADNEMPLGKEKSSGSVYESEIARLFPNT